MSGCILKQDILTSHSIFIPNKQLTCPDMIKIVYWDHPLFTRQQYDVCIVDEASQVALVFNDIYSMLQTIVATSCLGTNHPLFTPQQYDVCIVDEASQVALVFNDIYSMLQTIVVPRELI